MELPFLDAQAIEAARKQVAQEVSSAARKGALAIIGAAALPQKCAVALRELGGAPAAFIEYDPRFWGGQVLGAPVLSAREALDMLGPNAVAISGVWSPRHHYAETKFWISSFGFKKVYPVASVFWTLGDKLQAHYQLTAPNLYAELREPAENLMKLLADDESRRQFSDSLAWRVTLNETLIPRPDRQHVYFDPRLFKLPEDAVVVDVGAFDGDSLRSFLRWYGMDFGVFHALEPDSINFSRLESYVAGLPRDLAAKIRPSRVAAGAENRAGVIHRRRDDRARAGNRAAAEIHRRG